MHSYTPRTIAQLVEILHPPQPVGVGSVQKVHNRMFESGTPLYGNFQAIPEGAVLSHPVAQPGGASTAVFLVDRYQFREELTGLTIEDFAERVHHVSSEVAGLENHQVMNAQAVTLRMLVNPRNYSDSRALLKGELFGFQGRLTDFEHDPELYGFRLVFPATQESPARYALRVESFANDPRSLFVEVQGTFGGLVVARGLDPLRENVLSTYRFVTERALSFLAGFDQRQEA
ncbi:MAG: hypothetical protein WD226_11600 [Planctomycetota bacterium]